MGNVTTVTDAKGNIISSTVYNSLNLPSSVTDAAGKSTEYTYNSLGKVATITDPLNQVKTFEYNSRGQNVKVTDPLNGVSTAAYNAFGKVTALTGPTGAATNYTYDNLGRLTAETTPAGGSIEYGYNELYLRNEITNGRDQTHTLQYDMSGRIYSRVTPEGTIRYTYDGCNNITKVVGPNGTINRTFDKLNRVTSYTDALGKTVQYQYDAVGNLVKLIYPDNTAVTYAYDANHNLISVTDWEDRITTYTYDVNNKVTSIAKWDESVTSYTYDDAQRLISYTVCDYLNDVIVGYEYTYDHLGRVIMEKDLVKELQMSYTYDELSRVTKRSTYDLTDPEGEVEEETFSYDLAGNLTDDAGNATFTYGTNNRLTAYNNTAISYDLDGNMLNVGAMNCTYDSSNRLIAVGGLAYTYDAENTRIRSVNDTVETTYAYDVNARLSRLLMKTTGDEVKKYIYGLGLLYEDDGSDFLTYHFDLRGSTVAISDDSGMIVDTFEYDTYGKLLGHFGGTDTPFLYNGRDGVMTEPNGLYYMRNRYYSPEMRRFINADVIAGELANAVTMNRYAYANANPVMCIDPLGLSADGWENDSMKMILDMLWLINGNGISDYSKLFSSVLDEVLSIQDLFTFVNDKEFEIKVGNTTYFCSMKTSFGNGFIRIEDKAAVNMEILNSLSFSTPTNSFSKEVTKRKEITLEFSHNIDDYTSVKAVVSSDFFNFLSASFTVTTEDSDNNSITTTVGFKHTVDNTPKKISNLYQHEMSLTEMATVVIGGTIAVAILILNDGFVIGVADTALIPVIVERVIQSGKQIVDVLTSVPSIPVYNYGY